MSPAPRVLDLDGSSLRVDEAKNYELMNWTLRNSRQKLPSWNNQALNEEDPTLFVLIRAAGLRWSWVIQTNKLLRISWEFFSKTSLHPLSPWLVFNSSQPWMSKIAPIPDGDPMPGRWVKQWEISDKMLLLENKQRIEQTIAMPAQSRTKHNQLSFKFS